MMQHAHMEETETVTHDATIIGDFMRMRVDQSGVNTYPGGVITFAHGPRQSLIPRDLASS